MTLRRKFRHSPNVIKLFPLTLLLEILIAFNSQQTSLGASSSPKNLANLYANLPSYSSNNNLTATSSAQNEYQIRSSSKASATNIDRVRPSPTSNINYEQAILEAILGRSPVEGLSSAPDGGKSNWMEHAPYNFANTNVPVCNGRQVLNGTKGFITDGPGFYQTALQCTWLIDSGRSNATIRIQFHQFNTECNFDYLYIFDGDSIYSDLVAALSGDMKDFNTVFLESKSEHMISTKKDSRSNSHNLGNKHEAIVPLTSNDSQTFEIVTTSGKAFIYFHSDTAQSMHGFYMTYSIDSCPLGCSKQGECDYPTQTCKCNQGFYGSGCQFTACPKNCTSQLHGVCDNGHSCVCNDGYSGLDCSIGESQQVWLREKDSDSNAPMPPARAFHQSAIVNDTLWIIGGRSQPLSNFNTGIFAKKRVTTAFGFDMKQRRWLDRKLEGTTGIDHLAELSGFSVAPNGSRIIIYGGLAMNNSVLNDLSVLDTETLTISGFGSISRKGATSEEKFSAPLAVAGHSANIIGGYMYVFLGYNPVFGFVNIVQKFNLTDGSVQIINRRGGHISGRIGHSSVYDAGSGLVFVYGGHNSQKLSSLYSFNPVTETWTYLQNGPSARYYHGAVIVNHRMLILGGNSYNTSHQSDQCFQQQYLTYDLSCSKPAPSTNHIPEYNSRAAGEQHFACGRKCWQTWEDNQFSVMKRHGHSVVVYSGQLVLFGGFTGLIMNDLRFLMLGACEKLDQEMECNELRLGSLCAWNDTEKKCYDTSATFNSSSKSNLGLTYNTCTKTELRSLQHACESRGGCVDCLSTNIGCVWCGAVSQCQYNACKSSANKMISDIDSCLNDDIADDTKVSFLDMLPSRELPPGQDSFNELQCRQLENCFICQSNPHCSWHNDGCDRSSPELISSPSSALTPAAGPDDMPISDAYEDLSGIRVTPPTLVSPNNQLMQRLDSINRSFMPIPSAHSSPYSNCDVPCFLRRNCNECTSAKCIWCTTTEQCLESSAYFNYNAMGQCMYYVAHMSKCPVASCDSIQSCDRCLANPRCGWINDINNTGKGQCAEGNSTGPLQKLSNSSDSWHYTSCPACQCNGHSVCKANSSVCIQSCQDNTEGLHCERCVSGYFGDPINGGTCHRCRCNNHAQACNHETGKCYCSTKGVVGHNCNRCDDNYVGDPTNPSNGTCYYNLTTDYQYTFNLSKFEDYFYSDINFVNVPMRKDSDVDFSISCSRSALLNISSGTNFRNRKVIQLGLECGSFRLRFPQERHGLMETNYSFYVNVYKFQTPFLLQIAFSQHRTLGLPQFFFTFSSCFLFFFALSGLVWKLKHEYDLYVRRQRQFIEMEQMASRPFSTVLLEMFKPSAGYSSSEKMTKETLEPTPISFEPCFGNNIGVMSLFVQLPGKPNLAIGSALVTLNDDSTSSSDSNSSSGSNTSTLSGHEDGKVLEKDQSV